MQAERATGLVIFDLDGTLVDSGTDLWHAVNAMREHYGRDALPRDTVLGYIGDGMRRLVERSMAGTGVPVDAALARYRECYAATMVCHTRFYPGVEAALARLADAGRRLAVCSNKPGDWSRAIVAHLGAAHRFTHVLGGGDTPALKPEPEPLLRIAAATGVAPARAWMVGDHRTDVGAARAAGMRSLFVTWGMGRLGEDAPTAVADTPAAMADRLLASD